ncbi:MAG: FecR domain-containing protein [Eubacteriales bacterium]
MKKTKLLPLFLALGLIFTGCSSEDESTNSSSSDSSQEGSSLFGNILGGGDSATSADEMRLENFTGSITLQNNSEEKAVVLGSRLVTGDNIETMVESNAYVVLDKSKVLRVNETSQVEIVQEEKHLDIYLSKGTVFFNVTSTLSAEESLEFHTNNVVTGVRGTSGIIHFDPVAQVTQIVVLTGTVTGTTASEEQNIEAGQVAIVETLPDGTVEMTIYELEEENPLYYFPNHFIDGMQGDLNGEGQSLPLSEMVRMPDEISISGKVLSISNVLAVEDENGKLHSIDNNSGQTWEGVSLGGMVNLTYFEDSVVSIEQTSQGADVVGVVLEMFPYSYLGYDYIYIDISTPVLTQAEKEVFITRLQLGYTNTELRLGGWEELSADAESKGVTMQTLDSYPYNRYEGYGSYGIGDLSETQYGVFNIPTDAGIENFGLSFAGQGMYFFQAILNPDTMEYTSIYHGGAG